MSDSLSEQANRKALDAVKPNQLVVGGYYKDGKLFGGVTYERKWSNGWGVAAFARAWVEGKAVTPQKASIEAGAEVTKKF